MLSVKLSNLFIFKVVTHHDRQQQGSNMQATILHYFYYGLVEAQCSIANIFGYKMSDVLEIERPNVISKVCKICAKND